MMWVVYRAGGHFHVIGSLYVFIVKHCDVLQWFTSSRYEEGEIRDIRTVPSDKYWSINIKKGLVSLFQLKISGKSTPWSDTESLPESSSYSGSHYTPSNGSQRNIRNKLFESFNPIGSRRIMTSRLENAFKVMEVSAECSTVRCSRSAKGRCVSKSMTHYVADYYIISCVISY